jgi:hypothetical protein
MMLIHRRSCATASSEEEPRSSDAHPPHAALRRCLQRGRPRPGATAIRLRCSRPGDPGVFLDLSHGVYPDRNHPIREEHHLKKRNESSKQHDEDHHASNHGSIILDEHKNPRSNLYWITRQRRFPGGMIHGGAHDSFRLNNCTPLNPCNIPGCKARNIENTEVCIAFMHRKSRKFSCF